MDKESCLWDMPSLPLTEVFGPFKKHGFNANQKLMISEFTGEVYLKNQLPPSLLYSPENYHFSTGKFSSSKNSIERFKKFVDKVVERSDVNTVADVGGNNEYFLRQMGDMFKQGFIIDPVLVNQDGSRIENIEVIGNSIENIDMRSINPDIVFCRHTLEHIAKPKKMLEQLLLECNDSCLFIFEIPDFDCLMESKRFDAIFHQHFNYFSLEILSNLLKELGAEIISHEYNYQGSCGGALMFAFRKTNKKINFVPTNIEEKIKRFDDNKKIFDIQMEILGQTLEACKQPIYGFGASLLLPTMAYNLRTDFSNLAGLMDDDDTKNGLSYANLPLTVTSTKNMSIQKDQCFLVTSMESMRPILQRLMEFQPKKILIPGYI